MPELVRLKNNWPTAFTGTLYHDSYCRRGGDCGCKQEKFAETVRNAATGETGVRESMRQAPRGFSIPPKGSSEPFTRAITKVPGVSEAMATGQLTLEAMPAMHSPKLRVQTQASVPPPAPQLAVADPKKAKKSGE